ncbi:MAG: sugar transferase [Eubacteriales bacterium]|nr:sugar transferase [Eubacteriales bacterium]
MIIRKTNLIIKRLIDFIGSSLGLVILSPVFLVTIFLLEIFMPGPVLFRQQRVGENGKIFDILKFRSMKVDKEAEKNHDFSKDEERKTPFGNLIRRLKIDELPQLINVFRGDMSLVGPRPTVKEQTDLYTDYQRQRLNMRPGMTGLAQVNGNISLTWDERIEYDVEYVTKFSIWLDLKILLKTVAVVICGENKFNKQERK